MRRTAVSPAVVAGYLALWTYAWTHAEALPSLNSIAEQWAFFLCVIALHVAIGYLIGNPWAIALAAAPALTLIPAGMPTGALFLVMIAEGVPIAAFITLGVLLKRHRETRFHTL